MKITHFVESLGRGGLERVVVDLAREQSINGHACQIVCLFERGLLASEAEEYGIEVHCCYKRSGPDLTALRQLRRYIAEHGTDVLHTHNAVAHYYGVLASRFSSVRKVVNTRHGMGASQSSLKRELLYRLAMIFTTVGVSVSEQVRDSIVSKDILLKRKSRVVKNGIRVEEFTADPTLVKTQFLTMSDLPEATIVIGTVGRLNPAKNHKLLLQAYAHVRKNIPDSVLLIVGDGPLKNELVSATTKIGLNGFVRFLGDRDDVRSLLAAFDLFVLPSVSEGYSIALLEACAAGLPIVATDVGGNREIVRDRISGLIVPPQDVGHLANAMLDILSDCSLARAMGQANRQWCQEFASVRFMTSEYQKIYDS